MVAAESAVAAVLGMVRAGAGWAVAVAATVGVVRGGAAVVEAGLTAGSVLPATASWTRGLAVWACSAVRGGASRSSSRAAGGAPLAGLIKPAGLALRDRRLSLGMSSAALAKLNSPGSVLGSLFVAGI